MPAVNGLDHKSGARDAIAGCKNARASGGKGVGIDGNGFASGQANASIVRDKGKAGPLTHRENHCIAREDMIRVGDFFNVQPAVFIKTERADRHAFDTTGVTMFVANDSFKCTPRVEGNAFSNRGVHFPGMGGHCIAAFQAGHGNLAAQAQRAARHINRNVAAPQYQDVFAQRRSIRAVDLSAIIALVFVEAHIAQKVGIDQNTL